MVNFSDPEGYIDSSEEPPLPDSTFVHCTYTVTVYTGYGVELQVRATLKHTHTTVMQLNLTQVSDWTSAGTEVPLI